jgi:hypothetical protein
MTANSKRILITTVSREFFILHGSGNRTVHQFCLLCGRDVEMLTLATAVDLSRYSTRDVIANVESGSLHAYENADGHLLICGDSFERFLRGVEK